MSNDVKDQELNEEFTSKLEDLLKSSSGDDGVLSNRPSTIRTAAFHDFSEYRYLMTPIRGFGPVDIDPIPTATTSPIGFNKSTIQSKDQFISHFRALMSSMVRNEVPGQVSRFRDGCIPGNPGRGGKPPWKDDPGGVDDCIDNVPRTNIISDQQLIYSLLGGFDRGMGEPLYAAFLYYGQTTAILKIIYTEVEKFTTDLIYEKLGNGDAFWEVQLERLLQPESWSPGVEGVFEALSDYEPPVEEPPEEDECPLPDNYSFEPYLPESVNFGLQVVYRQAWTPLGSQPGEIVRTLPLGPKQIEKVTFKAIRRTKAMRQSEVVTSIETATESSVSTKDSSEVVKEASDSFNWNTEVSANASWGWGGANMKTGMGGDSASSSSDSKSILNETMEKTASKMRSETKIVVSTETEETTEVENYSEIANPNDATAVTYVYSRMQKQYEIRTVLNEVNTVVFVAETLPLPSEINEDWIRRYDWVLARELLEETFRDDLNNIRRQGNMESGDEEVDPKISKMMDSLKNGIPSYDKLPGTIPDFFQNPQQAYEREIERKRARKKEHKQHLQSLERLQLHIYENILHYCRAIWTSEDPSMRMMRYEKIRIPIKWDFVAQSSCGENVTDDACEGNIEGYYTPNVTDPDCDTIPLSEIINPIGPIGFMGNYAAFYFRQSGRHKSLENVLSQVKMPYSQLAVHVKHVTTEEESPFILNAYAGPNRISEGSYTLVFSREIGDFGGFDVTPDCGLQCRTELTDSMVQFLDICIKIDKHEIISRDLQDGDTFCVSVRVVPVLEDPELKAIRWDNPPPSRSEEEYFFTNELLEHFVELFPEFASTAEDEGILALEWNQLSSNLKSMVRENFAEYILRDRHTRQLLLDTNNLLLSRVVDDASTLEPFKGLHRYLDVLDAYADLRRKQLENERREKRIGQDKLGDPDIEKVTVVAGSREAAELAGLDALTSDTDGEDQSDGT